ncbi:protein kinase [Streptomyces sp. NPDC058045]|uniref:serine/threonine-protein kinase n=1 Tax=Streptomyces sp. NPDC058045 TaxID=3346311 RepID=UPI0036E2641D
MSEAEQAGEARQDKDAPLLAGRYRLGEVLGRGGMGTVWRALDEVLGRTVAVKELRFPSSVDEDEKRRLITRTLREAKAIARISNTSAVTVYDVVDEDDRPWIVMELVEGKSLAEVIREDGLLTPKRAAEVGLAILDVLRSAHRQGILHRDVKPSNVLIAEDGRVVLTDFGIAQVEGDPSITSTGMLVGAPSYISPERARGHKPGPAADLWSLGGLLYAAVEGTPPYDKGSAIATLTAVMTESVEKPKNAGPLLEKVIYGLLVKDPDRRLDDAGARAMLTEVLTTPEPSAERDDATKSLPVVGPGPEDEGPAGRSDGRRSEEAPGPRLRGALRSVRKAAAAATGAKAAGAKAAGGRHRPSPAAAAPVVPPPPAVPPTGAGSGAGAAEASAGSGTVPDPRAAMGTSGLSSVGAAGTSGAAGTTDDSGATGAAGAQDGDGTTKGAAGSVAAVGSGKGAAGSVESAKSAGSPGISGADKSDADQASHGTGNAAGDSAGRSSRSRAGVPLAKKGAKKGSAVAATAVGAAAVEGTAAASAPATGTPATSTSEATSPPEATATPATSAPATSAPATPSPLSAPVPAEASADAALGSAGAVTVPPPPQGAPGGGSRGGAKASITDVVSRRSLVVIALVAVLAVIGTVLAVTLGNDDGTKGGHQGGDTSTSGGAASGGTGGQADGSGGKGDGKDTGHGTDKGSGGQDSGSGDHSGDPDSGKGADPGRDGSGGSGGGSGDDSITTYRHAQGFSIGLPAGWKYEKTDGAGARFTGPDQQKLLVGWTTSPKANPVLDWRRQERDMRRSQYHRIRIEGLDYRGWPAADWEFTYVESGTKFRSVDRGFVVGPKLGHALMYTAKAGSWGDSVRKDTWRTFTRSFKPKS